MPENQSGQVTELLQHWKKTSKRSTLRCRSSTKSYGALLITISNQNDHTLQSTALVHEACLRLWGGQPVDFQNRAHFTAVASRLMR
jgi:hypothetical protein